MKFRLPVLIVLALTLTACADIGLHALPEKYRTALSSLRTQNIEIDRKIQDLQKQIADLNTERQFNCARENSLANEALNSLNLSGTDYQVNVDTLEIQSSHRR